MTGGDADGIPDGAEVQGGTYSGIAFYELGARMGRKDIFVAIDHMAGADPATLPRKDALNKVVEAFRQKNIFVHFRRGPAVLGQFDSLRHPHRRRRPPHRRSLPCPDEPTNLE